MIDVLLRSLFLVAIAIASTLGCAWVYRKSATLGLIVIVGTLVRLALGVALYVTSKYHLPILTTLQAGDGFWTLAPDAGIYYALASDAASGQSTVLLGSPSPAYIRVLALWLSAAGETPMNAVLFNVVCYLVAAIGLASLSGPRLQRWLPVVLISFSFYPALVLSSSQVLKDAFFVTLIVVSGISVRTMLRCMCASNLEHAYLLSVSVAATAIAIAVIGGVRTYYALFIWVAIAVALALAWWIHGKGSRVSRALLSAWLLILFWAAFMVGAGAYYQYYGELITRTAGTRIPIVSGFSSVQEPASADLSEPIKRLESLRDGFIDAGGATNLIRKQSSGPTSVRDMVRDTGIGMATLFVPISVLKALSIVKFEGGRGFLTITDLDTIFLDASLLAMGWMAYRWRATAAWNGPALLFFVALTIISAVTIAYVVTNFGTSFRLRMLTAAPAWMWPLAFGIGASEPQHTPRSFAKTTVTCVE